MSALAGLLALGACATMPGYQKEGADADETEATYDSCRRQARSLTNREEVITHDIRSARTPSMRPGAAAFIDEMEDLGPRRRLGDIVDDCMRRQGYQSE